ncbi:hypothetical protein HanRHA438_Chr13g0584371 [Helianthus annuus]|nr:hypothetical protein HanHA300_Chr13g0469801 [Helianthus annuus]KAJ0479800.1 hypothetical protein HanIR_Chr13g0624231 [Helianthus annuus]KAJ0662641.1 hypothetical protein HanLR1_Chr13g0472011 [Helianthus annuus]KAJ0847988.1 hypothetical protein HanPSC8_Chr13g0551871 [Helianthus annuus]KAJ0856943.1 hypothetical protein HanRHA438_Chr13g0584371 [Helianthus annuus]
MSVHDQTARSIKLTYEEIEDEQLVIDSIVNATRPSTSTKRMHRVPEMLIRETDDYKKYYVPKVVSIGPHHFGDKKLELVEKLKPVFTMKLLSDNKESLRSLYKKLGELEMVQDLRNFYDENMVAKFCNKDFIKMMLLDCCFILYYIQSIFGEKPEDCLDLNSHVIVFLHQDLFLLENQIPFKVLREVMNLANIDCENKFKQFICGNILVPAKPEKKWLQSIPCIGNLQSSRGEQNMDFKDVDHLLHLLHRTLTKNARIPGMDLHPHDRCTFRNVNELIDVGIHFKPSGTMSLANIKFTKGRWWFTASVELPSVTVDDSTKPMLLNLIAYEMCSRNEAWVTSYICLLDSLIDHPEDVKALRKAGVLENSLGSDKEVTKLFNEIGTDLVPNMLAYLDAMNMIQKHYQSWSNTLISQLKHEYVKSPWAFFALLGALIALFLSSVQAYFTVWSPKGECDDLCMFLKKYHHL